MVVNLKANFWRPEVWAELTHREFLGRVVVGGSAAVLQDDTLQGSPGDTIVMPKWMNLTEMADIAENASLVPEKMSQSASRATIKEAGKAVEWSDQAQLAGVGNVQAEAVRQFGVLAARKVDSDLIAAATQTTAGGTTYADGTAATNEACLTFDATANTVSNSLTWANILGASLAFGDAYDPSDFAGLFVRSATMATLLADDDFLTANQGAAGNSLIKTGQVGTINGLTVYVTDRLPVNRALLLQKNSLGLFYKRRPLIEQDRDILARTTVTSINMHYGVKRLKDTGVVNISLKA